MARNAFHAEAADVTMIEVELSRGNDSCRHFVAERALRRTGTGRLSLEMAECAGRLSHRDVAALDDLRMAGSAAQAFAVPQLRQMWSMIEEHAAEKHLPLEQTALVALQARCILHLGPGIRPVGAGKVPSHHGYGFVLLTQLSGDTGSNMTIDASYVRVIRRLP